jgi:hypothetical protein
MRNISTAVRGYYDDDSYMWAIIIRRFCDTARPHHAQQFRCARRSLARSRTRASRRGHAPSACTCPCPCRGSCRRRALNRRPPHHSVASSFVPVSSSASSSLHLSKQQAYAAMKAHDAIVCLKYFRCFRGMLEVLYIDVAKVDRNVAHVVIIVHVRFNCMF